jgi:hypothetical protein
MIAMVINVTIHFLVTFLTKITNLPMVTFVIILTSLSSVQWLIWLCERVRSFFPPSAHISYIVLFSVQHNNFIHNLLSAIYLHCAVAIVLSRSASS